MQKSGVAAARQMWLWMKSKRTGVQGYCLKTCREAWDLPAQDPSAIEEWESIRPSRKFTNWRDAPIGAPHFWAGGKYGHIALQANKKGYVLSTDAPKGDLIGRVRISWFPKYWGYKYLGWTTELQGKKLPLKEMPKASVYSIVKRGK